ncbi:MAG: DUF4364 family protein [Coprococcus sp.]
MLNKVDFPLTNSQISEFILDKGYTNYFTASAGAPRPFRYRIDPNRTYPQQFLLFHEPVR